MRSLYCRSGALRLTWLAVCLALSNLVLAAGPSTGRVAQASGATGDSSVNIIISRTPDKEKLKFAEAAVEEIRDGLAGLQKAVEEARKNKKVMLLNCLNERFSAVSALYKITETATILLQEALSQNNSTQADHQFRKIVIARFKARQLLQEASECTGDDDTQGPGEEPTVTVDSALEGGKTITDEPVDVIDTDTDPVDVNPLPPPTE